MEKNLNEKGNYEIFKTTGDNEILRLGKSEIYAIVETNKGPILIKTDEDHQKQETIEKGIFYLVDFEEDPAFQDMPHLFIEKGTKYQELLLPSGFPDASRDRKKIIFTRKNVDEEKIRRHSKNNIQQVRQKEEFREMEPGRMAGKINMKDVQK